MGFWKLRGRVCLLFVVDRVVWCGWWFGTGGWFGTGEWVGMGMDGNGWDGNGPAQEGCLDDLACLDWIFGRVVDHQEGCLSMEESLIRTNAYMRASINTHPFDFSACQ